MRNNFGADWAFGVKGAIENVVRKSFPSELRRWPLLQTFDFESYLIGDSHFIVVLRDKLSGIPSGFDPKAFPYNDHPSLPATPQNVETWQSYLFVKFALRPEDAALVLPIHNSGKSSAGEDYDLFSSEEKAVWDLQLRLTVARQQTMIQPIPSSAPQAPVNITYNVSGTNVRVNTNSVDSSTQNTVNAGTISNATIQQGGAHATMTQSVNYTQEDSDNLQRLVEVFQKHIDDLGLDAKAKRRVIAQVATIKAQLEDTPDPVIVKQAGSTLWSITEKVIAGLIVAASTNPTVWTQVHAIMSKLF